MKSPRAPLASLVVAALLFPRAAFAWSANGHSTIGQIAQDLLNQAAQKNGDAASQTALDTIKVILTSDPADSGFVWSDKALASLAPCADAIRAQAQAPAEAHAAQASPEFPPSPKVGDTVTCAGLHFTAAATGPLHFVDVSITAPAAPESVTSACSAAGDVLLPGAGGDCVVDAIKYNVDILKNPSASMSDKKLALAYVVHFVGDEHQPLHCATQYVDPAHTGPNDQSDRGGNGKLVKFNGATLNLHALWDHMVAVTDAGNDPAVLSQELEAALPGDTKPEWTQGDFVAAAANESFGIAQSDIYPPFNGPVNGYKTTTLLVDNVKKTVLILPPDYQLKRQQVVYPRLEMGGVRLAALLKQALGGQPSAPAVLAPPAR